MFRSVKDSWGPPHASSREVNDRKSSCRTASIEKHKEIVRLCNVANYEGPLELGPYLQARLARLSSGRRLCILCGGCDVPTNPDGSELLRRMEPGRRIGPVKDIGIFRIRAKSGIDVCVSSARGLCNISLGNCLLERSSNLLTDRGGRNRNYERIV